MAMLVAIFACTFVAVCGGQLDVEDILDANYLPGTLFLLDADHRTDNHTRNTSHNVGDLGDAFVTMNFHRKMMNEYLCRSYVAEQILSGVEEPRVIQERRGTPVINTTSQPTGRPRHKKYRTSAVKQSLLDDPGSSHYKNWLDRTTTLEDIYRHYEDLTSDDDSSHDDFHSTGPEYDGEVTGFAVHHHPGYLTGHATSGPGKLGGHSGYGDTGFSSSGSGYGTSSTGYSYQPSEKAEKGISLKDLFDLALTALAFLSFGMFVLNIIMCLAGSDSSETTIDPEVETSTGVRVRRSFPTFGVSKTETLNIMAGRVLRSIEAFQASHYGAGTVGSEDCLRRALCDNNRFSRSLEGSDRIWLPVWSLGLSWVAGRFSPTLNAKVAMLEYLRASLLGLGNSRCEKLFPNCPDNLLASSRNARREKRQRSKRRGDTGPMEVPSGGQT